MHAGTLIVRAERKGRIFELIPITAMTGDFPHVFIEQFVHWLDQSTGTIEFRPLESPWVSSDDNWIMKGFQVNKYQLERGSQILVDIRSTTSIAVCALLSPIEAPKHIQTVLNRQTNQLEVDLPRLKLGFYMDKNGKKLASKQFRGMSIDNNQSIGTLTGLKNKLVLGNELGSLQMVIIPYGTVTFGPKSNHVFVAIDTGHGEHIHAHCFQVDHRLGRLVDNGSHTSRLFLSYLHALTAHCLPDSLTKLTGTEQALSILRAGSTRSFFQLEEIDRSLLKLIAELTPQRNFNMDHMRVMQQIVWQSLPILSQHAQFFEVVEEIWKQEEKFLMFYPKPKVDDEDEPEPDEEEEFEEDEDEY